MYVANYGSNTVSEYERNTATGSLEPRGTAEPGEHPHALAISPDGKSLYVTDSAPNGEVVAYARGSNGGLTETGSSAAGKFTENVVVSRDGDSVYATSFTTKTVYEFSRNVVTGALTELSGGPAGTGKEPEGVAISPDGKNVYVANYNNGAQGEVSQYARKLTPNKFVNGTIACMVVGGQAGSGPVQVTVEATGTGEYAPGQGQAPVQLPGYHQVLNAQLSSGSDQFALLANGLPVEGQASGCKAGSFGGLNQDLSNGLQISAGIASPADGTANYSGSVTLSGATEPGAAVVVSDGASQLPTSPAANGNGEWAQTVGGLSAGVHVFSARSGTSQVSNTVTIDVIAPTITTPANESTGVAGSLPLAGTGQPNAQIGIYEGASIAEGQAPVAVATSEAGVNGRRRCRAWRPECTCSSLG